MTTSQMIEAARSKLPFTSEFEHDVIRIPVRNNYHLNTEESLLQPNALSTTAKPFYEVEFRKQYIKNVAIGWEFVNIY